MKPSTAIIIFFLSIIALVAEIILFMLLASGAGNSAGTISAVFIWLMFVTVTIGILAPVGTLVERKVKNASLWIVLGGVVIVSGFYGLFILMGFM